jgi:hypothetical protein
MFKSIKYFIQRGKRGYSDEDVWDFDNYLCSIIPPAIRELKRITSVVQATYMIKMRLTTNHINGQIF